MKILFVCTHNRCRSILAEVIANHYGEGLITAASAGSTPAGEVHPLTIRALEAGQLPVKGLASKHWDDMQSFAPDYVITVCDKAAGEPCPVWFGEALKAHWGIADPSAVTGSDKDIQAAFESTIQVLTNRIKKLAALLQQNPDKTTVLECLNRLATEFGH